MTPTLYQSQLDAEIAALVPGYLEACREQIDALQALWATAQREPSFWIAHRLQGSGDAYGCPGIAAGARALVAAIRAEDMARIPRLIESLSDHLDTLRSGG